MGWQNDLVTPSKSKMFFSPMDLRRQRKDTFVLIGLVALFPGAYNLKNPEYLRWLELVTK